MIISCTYNVGYDAVGREAVVSSARCGARVRLFAIYRAEKKNLSLFSRFSGARRRQVIRIARDPCETRTPSLNPFLPTPHTYVVYGPEHDTETYVDLMICVHTRVYNTRQRHVYTSRRKTGKCCLRCNYNAIYNRR